MRLEIYHSERGAYISGDKAWSPFNVGETIKHRLRMEDGKVVDVVIDSIRQDGEISAGRYEHISHERAFEENPRPISKKDLAKRVEELLRSE